MRAIFDRSSLSSSRPRVVASFISAVFVGAFALSIGGSAAALAQDATTPPAEQPAEQPAAGEPAGTDTTAADAVGDDAGGAEAGAGAGAEATTPANTALEGGEAATTDAPPSTAGMQTADQEYDLRLRELEGKINDLKDSIFRSKAKLTLLTEQVTGGLGGGSGLVILHKNDMGGAYLLTEAHYFLDGQELWQEVDDTGERLSERKEYSVFEGNIVEGSHTLTVNIRIQGNGSGIFSYMSGYTWNLKDSYTFSAEPGKRVKITTSVYESGNFTTEINDRPKIRFETEIETQKKEQPQ